VAREAERVALPWCIAIWNAQISFFQTTRRLNVANDFVSEYFKNRMFLDKIGLFQFDSHFSVNNNNSKGQQRYPYH